MGEENDCEEQKRGRGDEKRRGEWERNIGEGRGGRERKNGREEEKERKIEGKEEYSIRYNIIIV